MRAFNASYPRFLQFFSSFFLFVGSLQINSTVEFNLFLSVSCISRPPGYPPPETEGILGSVNRNLVEVRTPAWIETLIEVPSETCCKWRKSGKLDAAAVGGDVLSSRLIELRREMRDEAQAYLRYVAINFDT